jgi:hypothetical protein
VCPGLAHWTVRCATGQCPVHQGTRLQTCHLREFWEPLRYNSPDCLVHHRTVRCASGVTATQRQQSSATAVNALQCTQKSEQSQKAHRTVNSDCPVRHRTIRWPRCQKLQQSESNGRVTWLVHRTVSDGAPDRLVRHATAASTNGSFGGWGYKYPQPPTIHCIQVFSLHTSYQSYSIQYKTQTKRSNPLPSPESLEPN